MDGIGIDVALGGLPFETSTVERASSCEYEGGLCLRTCSAEDLIVLKAFANRNRDWDDIESVIVRNRETLDWNLIHRELKPLAELKETPEIPRRLEHLRRSL
ncbi:MAG TPA: nucleotidyltransferase [Verrucomicrobiae bacterium]|nr:nucleotidyltransferase [Verrucomicrobiae bacterium]